MRSSPAPKSAATRKSYRAWHNSVGLTVFTRRGEGQDWIASALTVEDILQLPEIGLEIPVAELYENVDLPETETAAPTPMPDQPGLR
ncbi:MAG TPA: hypothetical protein VJX94_13100 [Stellaceae bacterium]|nr:hypothetical protein [Stellaceae bacterium]